MAPKHRKVKMLKSVAQLVAPEHSKGITVTARIPKDANKKLLCRQHTPKKETGRSSRKREEFLAEVSRILQRAAADLFGSSSGHDHFGSTIAQPERERG